MARKKTEHDFIPVTEAGFQYQEAVKSLRTNLQFVALEKECKKIVVTSSIPGEGKSTLSVNLSISLAEAGHKVLLIDCDLRKPRIHKLLNIRNAEYKGITQVLTGANLSDSILNIPSLGIRVMVADAIPPNPAELLGSDRMKSLVEQLEKRYDYIIFDTPPVSVVTDAAVLSTMADGVILVVRQKYATFDQVTQAKRNLQAVNAPIVGAVLSCYDSKKSAKDSDYSDYSYTEE